MCRDGLGSPFECQFSIIQARSENMGGGGGERLSKPVKYFK